MVSYDDMRAWVRRHDLVMNRAKVINDITDDLLVVGHKGCRYWVEFLGRRICDWRAYDLESVNQALACLQGVEYVLWDCRRLGYASF